MYRCVYKLPTSSPCHNFYNVQKKSMRKCKQLGLGTGQTRNWSHEKAKDTSENNATEKGGRKMEWAAARSAEFFRGSLA